MSDYTKLVEQLKDYSSCRKGEIAELTADAAAAIEGLVESVHIRDKHLDELNQYIWELEAQLPKRGEWILQASGQDCKCSVCESYWIPFGDEYDYKFCPNCGAKMTEVQDGK